MILLQVLDYNGGFVRTIRHCGSGEFATLLLSIAVRGGLLLVADHMNDRVQVLTTKGEFVTEFPSQDDKTALSLPSCVAFDTHDPNGVLVGDDNGIHYFTFNATKPKASSSLSSAYMHPARHNSFKWLVGTPNIVWNPVEGKAFLRTLSQLSCICQPSLHSRYYVSLVQLVV